MTFQRLALGAATVLTALLLQLGFVSRLPLPGGVPDLVLVLVLAFGLVEGAMAGTVTGFVAGLLTDALSDHQVGRLALAYLLAGALAGRLHDDSERSTLQPFVAVGLGSAVAVATYAGVGVLLADPRISVGSVGRAGGATVAYDLVLTPFVVPLVAALVRRLDLDPLGRL